MVLTFGLQTRSLPGPHFDNHLTMMQAALAGQGIALGWIGTSEFVRAGQLVELLDDKIPADGGVYLVWRTSVPFTPPTRTFARWILARARDAMVEPARLALANADPHRNAIDRIGIQDRGVNVAAAAASPIRKRLKLP